MFYSQESSLLPVKESNWQATAGWLQRMLPACPPSQSLRAQNVHRANLSLARGPSYPAEGQLLESKLEDPLGAAVKPGSVFCRSRSWVNKRLASSQEQRRKPPKAGVFALIPLNLCLPDRPVFQKHMMLVCLLLRIVSKHVEIAIIEEKSWNKW